MEDIETGTRVVLLTARQAEPDPHNLAGWEGEVIAVHIVTDEIAEINTGLYEGETYYTVRWDNGYESDVFPADGDQVVPCNAR